MNQAIRVTLALRVYTASDTTYESDSRALASSRCASILASLSNACRRCAAMTRGGRADDGSMTGRVNGQQRPGTSDQQSFDSVASAHHVVARIGIIAPIRTVVVVKHSGVAVTLIDAAES